jgi:hypothetical protein
MARLDSAPASSHVCLAAAALRRDPAAFETLLGGKTGVGGVYDLWRRLKAFFRGERFRSAHGNEDPAAARLGGVS